MKVLWLSPYDLLIDKDINSSGGWIDMLFQHLPIKENVELIYICLSNRKTEHHNKNETKYWYLKRDHTNKFQRWCIRRFGLSYERTTYTGFLDILTKEKPDLIHIHGTEFTYPKEIQNTEIPVIISIQGVLGSIYIKAFQGLPRHFMRAHTSILDHILAKGPYYSALELATSLKRERVYLKDALNVIGRTDFDYRACQVLAPNANYYHCSEILRPLFYASEWKQEKREVLTVFSTLNSTVYKGFEVIAYAILEFQKIGINIKWLIAGLSKNMKVVSLTTKMVKTKSFLDNIQFMGSCNDEEIVRGFMKSDMYVQVSHIENSPNSLCEAMLTGMPCIASYAGGTSSLMVENNDGVMYQDGDYISLCGAIIDLNHNEGKARDLGKNARMKSIVRHDPKLIVRDLYNIYLQVLENK